MERIEAIAQTPCGTCSAHVKQPSATYPCAPATCTRRAVVLLCRRVDGVLGRAYLGSFCRQHARSLYGYRVGPSRLAARFPLGGAQ